MKLGKKNGALLLTLIAFAIFTLAVGSPVQADPPGSEFVGFFGGTVSTPNGDTLEMPFPGPFPFTLHPKTIDAGGPYTLTLATGEEITGTWEATKLEAFHSIGLCGDSVVCTEAFGTGAADFNAGRISAKIVLLDEAGERVGRARLTIWCSLPGIPAPPVKDHLGDGVLRGVEGFNVDMGSLHFGDGARAQRSGTLFIQTAE